MIAQQSELQLHFGEENSDERDVQSLHLGTDQWIGRFSKPAIALGDKEGILPPFVSLFGVGDNAGPHYHVQLNPSACKNEPSVLEPQNTHTS